MKKALFFINSSIPIYPGGNTAGGVEVFVATLATALANIGWTCDIVASKDSKSYISGVNIIPLNVDSTVLKMRNGHTASFDWKYYMELTKSLNVDSYDLIHVDNHYLPLLKYLNDNVSSKKIVNYYQILPRWGDCRQYATEAQKMENVYHLAISDLIKSKWGELGIDLTYFPYGFIDGMTGMPKEIDYNHFVISARIVPEKKVDLFAKLFKQIKTKGTIIGYDTGHPHTAKLLKALEGNEYVIWNKKYSGSQALLYSYLSRYNPIITSLATIEALGITPIEGFMFGLPCVTIVRPQSAISETISRGDELYNHNNEFILTSLGGYASDDKSFAKMIQYIQEFKPFDPVKIRMHWLSNYDIVSHVTKLLRLIDGK